MMRILNEQDVEINEKDADLSLGYFREEVIIRPDAAKVDDKAKFAYADEDYETVRRYILVPKEDRIAALKRKLAETDYCVIKIAEGCAEREEYLGLIAQRQEWRAEINRLEEE